MKAKVEAKEPRPKLTLQQMAGGDGAAVGLRCPKCHAQQIRVDTTRQIVEGVVRYRVCRICGTRWRTEER